MNDLQERFSGLSEKMLQSQLELTHLFTQEVERFLDLLYDCQAINQPSGNPASRADRGSRFASSVGSEQRNGCASAR